MRAVYTGRYYSEKRRFLVDRFFPPLLILVLGSHQLGCHALYIAETRTVGLPDFRIDLEVSINVSMAILILLLTSL